ncbi:MAG TPA: hypothetical protein DIC36_01345 [Gammaproteobacteria bacterium]|nr:hypothetical protein [Gammaproteobacteria bacterium]
MKPSAWVIPSADKGGLNFDINAIRQPVKTSLEVVYNIASAGDAQGHAAHAGLRTARLAAWAKLIGWTPTGMCLPLSYDSGALVHLGGGLMQWVDKFATEFEASYPIQ